MSKELTLDDVFKDIKRIFKKKLEETPEGFDIPKEGLEIEWSDGHKETILPEGE